MNRGGGGGIGDGWRYIVSITVRRIEHCMHIEWIKKR